MTLPVLSLDPLIFKNVMSHKPLILLVEDESPIRKLLRAALPDDQYRLVEADSGKLAIRLAAEQPPDVVLLDLGLPDIDGQDLLKQLREWLTAPIIVLSARDQEEQKVQALDAGADDYLTKPFSTNELLARIRVTLRRAQRIGTSPQSSHFEHGNLRLDLAARRVFVSDVEVHLTPLEYKLLITMTQHVGRVLTHRFLLKEIWGPHEVVEPHNLRVLMAALRRKIERNPTQPEHLVTEQGVGYRLPAE